VTPQAPGFDAGIGGEDVEGKRRPDAVSLPMEFGLGCQWLGFLGMR
jgi:hypothetical protein